MLKEIANYMRELPVRPDAKCIQDLAELLVSLQLERPPKVAGTAENAPSIYTLLGVTKKSIRFSTSPRIAVNPESIEITKKNRRKNRRRTHPPTSLDCVECVCDSHPGGNGSEEGNIPLAAKAGRRRASKSNS